MNAETPLAPLFAVALHAENLDVQARFDYLEFRNVVRHPATAI